MYVALYRGHSFYLFFLVTVVILFQRCNLTAPQMTEASEDHSAYQIDYPIQLKYGFNIREVVFEDHKIAPNSFMSNILMGYGIAFNKIIELEQKAEEVFSLRKLNSGKDLIFVRKDACEAPVCVVYEPNAFQYVLFTLGDEISVTKFDKPYEICQKIISGVITNNLSQDLISRGGNLELVDKIEDALSQVYFPGAQYGDQYRLVYEEIKIDDEIVGIADLLAAHYRSGEKNYYGYYYANEQYKGFYDESGNANKRAFLKSPIRERYRISSRYSKNRFHPVLKYNKPHLGTDFAAAKGTPIMAAADGVIIQRGYNNGNGNFVKIRHDKVYETQYLHMSKFASNVIVGTRVRQGQTIGYVGQTGLATGPHVCYRFWKNGRQVDPLRENFAPIQPLVKAEMPAFNQRVQELNKMLEDIPFVEPQQEVVLEEDTFLEEDIQL